MDRIKKYGSIAVVFIGLGLIFLYLKSKAPNESSLEFVLPPEGVRASRIMLEYVKTEDGIEEPYRRVDKFPKGSVLKIIDKPNLPEGDYIINLKIWVGDEVKSFRKPYSHGENDLTRFEIDL